MDVKQFIQNFRDAFGQKAALPLLFGYSNQPIADTERINGCIFKGLQAAREGVPVSLSAEIIACGGGKALHWIYGYARARAGICLVEGEIQENTANGY